jgi:hypothetical protein
MTTGLNITYATYNAESYLCAMAGRESHLRILFQQAQNPLSIEPKFRKLRQNPSSKKGARPRRNMRPSWRIVPPGSAAWNPASRGVASLIRGLPNKSLQLSRKGARMRPFPLEELCCSDQQHGTLLGYLPEFVSYESPSTQWATQLVLSGPVKAVGSS